MHHRRGSRCFDGQGNRFGIAQIPLDKDRPRIHRLAVTLRQIVEDEDFIASIKQPFNTDASDIACAACDKDFHWSVVLNCF
jgi:hypothetical protein